MKKMTYFLLFEQGDESARLDITSAKSLRQCRKCLTFACPLESTKIVLRYAPRGQLVTFIWDTNVTLISKVFSDAIKSALGGRWSDYLDTFDIAVAGEKSAEYVAIQCKNHLTVRGSENITYCKCSECGNVSYIGFGHRYLLDPIDVSIPVFESNAGWIVIRKDIMRLLEVDKSELAREELQIEQETRDGLPLNLHIFKV